MLTFSKVGGFLTAKLAKKGISLRGSKQYTITEADADTILSVIRNKDRVATMQVKHQELLGDMRGLGSMMKVFGANAGFSCEVKEGEITRIYNPELCLYDESAKLKFAEMFGAISAPDTNLCLAVGQVVIPVYVIMDEDADFPVFRTLEIPGYSQVEGDLALFSYKNGAVVASVNFTGYSSDPATMKKMRGLKFTARVKNLREKDPATQKPVDKHTAAQIIQVLNSGDQTKVGDVLGAPVMGGVYVQPIEKLPFGMYPLLGYIQENRTSTTKGTSWVGHVIKTVNAAGEEILVRIPARFANSQYTVMVSVCPFTDPNGTVYEPDAETDEDLALFTGDRSVVFYEIEQNISNGTTYDNAILTMIERPNSEGFLAMPEGHTFDHATNTFKPIGAIGKPKNKPVVEEDDEPDFAPASVAVDEDADDLDLGEDDAFAGKISNTLQTGKSGGTAVAEAPAKAKARTTKAAPVAEKVEESDDDDDDEFEVM